MLMDETTLTEEELLRVQQLAEEAAREAEEQRQQVLDGLARQVESHYTRLKAARTSKKAQWLRALALFHYPFSDPHWNESIEQRFFGDKKPERAKPYANIVRSKCKNVISQLIAGQFATGDKNYNLLPSPKMQEDYQFPTDPVTACRNMEAEITDQLNKCNYGREYRKAIEDFVILGAAVLKGPNNSCEYKKTYVPETDSEGNTVYKTALLPLYQPAVWRRELWYVFPDDTTNDPNRLERVVEVHPNSPTEFQDLLTHKGFLPDQMQEAFKLGPSRDESDLFDFLAITESKDGNDLGKYIVKEYHGPINRKHLMDLGVVGDEPELGDEVFAEVWVCNGKTIRVATPVLESESEPPYAIAAYEADPGSVFGYGLPILLESQQRIVKTATEMLLDNAAISSGPQAIINTFKISPAVSGDDQSIRPWKVWKVDTPEGDINEAITFFSPPDKVEGLMNVINWSMQMAEIDSGVSEMIGGLASPQGQETGGATGLAIANQNSLTPLLYKQEILVDNLTTKVIKWMYHWNMQYNPREDIKGDFETDVRTPIKNLASQSAKLDLERLSMEVNQNPELAAVVKTDVLTSVRLAGMHIPWEQILRTPEEVAAWKEEQAANQQPDPNMLKAQAEMINAETRKEEIALKGRQLDFEMQQGQQREQMDFQEKMVNSQIRMAEVQGREKKAELEYMAAMAELAGKMEQGKEAAFAKLIMAKGQMDTQMAAEIMKNELRQQEVDVKNEEIALKKQGKTGI